MTSSMKIGFYARGCAWCPMQGVDIIDTGEEMALKTMNDA